MSLSLFAGKLRRGQISQCSRDSGHHIQKSDSIQTIVYSRLPVMKKSGRYNKMGKVKEEVKRLAVNFKQSDFGNNQEVLRNTKNSVSSPDGSNSLVILLSQMGISRHSTITWRIEDMIGILNKKVNDPSDLVDGQQD
ncbi:hypothetical protein Tco_1533764 [Tanacetum coccineum]